MTYFAYNGLKEIPLNSYIGRFPFKVNAGCFAMNSLCMQEDRSSLDKICCTKSGEEPRLVVQLGEDNDVITVFVCGDGLKICQATKMAEGLLYIIAVHFLVNLNYPTDYAQLLGFIQLLCLNIDFPHSLRSSSFVVLKESVAM
jgi:hypothetical protein